MNNDDANDGGSSSGSTSRTTKHVHYIWVQGRPTNIDKESGNVILLKYFMLIVLAASYMGYHRQ